ncbi:MAG: hypothetical protein ACM3MK_04770 [Chitinophagales bacterium]
MWIGRLNVVDACVSLQTGAGEWKLRDRLSINIDKIDKGDVENAQKGLASVDGFVSLYFFNVWHFCVQRSGGDIHETLYSVHCRRV